MTKIIAAFALVVAFSAPVAAAPFVEQSPWFQAKEQIRIAENLNGSDSN